MTIVLLASTAAALMFGAWQLRKRWNAEDEAERSRKMAAALEEQIFHNYDDQLTAWWNGLMDEPPRPTDG